MAMHPLSVGALRDVCSVIALLTTARYIGISVGQFQSSHIQNNQTKPNGHLGAPSPEGGGSNESPRVVKLRGSSSRSMRILTDASLLNAVFSTVESEAETLPDSTQALSRKAYVSNNPSAIL